MKTRWVLLLVLSSHLASARVLHVGQAQPYTNLASAATAVKPGDTILFNSGTYPGGDYISQLQGTLNKWITILAETEHGVIIQGGSNAWQLSDPAFVRIEGFIFQGQTGNGLNIDDAGSFDTPAHDVVLSDCIFRNMNATGNNDLLKMSGVDHFTVIECEFFNGAAGGSGIDMVGCHNGLINKNRFENMGSNAIQMKGGTQFITVERNLFKNCGARTLNLGGSTGLAYFRPQDAKFEAADLYVYSNIFIGSEAPVAYVGSTRVKVVNNTFYLPEKWVVRILQETVDPARFISCGDNSFENNIIYQGTISTETNIGPNTRPGSFVYHNNYWYHYQNASWVGPNLPVTDPGLVKNKNPQFTHVESENFSLSTGSPAIGIISGFTFPEYDYVGKAFSKIRSAGAMEGGLADRVYEGRMEERSIRIVSNRGAGKLTIEIPNGQSFTHVDLFNILGKKMFSGQQVNSTHYEIDWPDVTKGIFILQLNDGVSVFREKISIR